MRGKLRARALPTSPLAAPIVACVELMRIIPDNGSEYSDTLVTVKRYLLDGATSAFCAIGFSLVWPFSSPHPVSEGVGIGLGLALSSSDSRLAGLSLSQMPTGKASTA